MRELVPRRCQAAVHAGAGSVPPSATTLYPLRMADDWRVRVEFENEESRRDFADLLAAGLSPQGADTAQDLQGGHVSISGDDENLFVYADSPVRAESAHGVILAELDHHAISATTSAVEHWLADEERWDNEPAGDTWEEEVTEKGYAPWEVRVACRSRHEAVALTSTLEDEGYRPIRQWSHLIIGAATREGADALAARLHGEVEAGGAVVWEEAIDSDVVRPFVFFG
jgi:hypothetical protein